MTRFHAGHGALALTLTLGACAGDDAHEENEFAELADINNVGALTGEAVPAGAGDISVSGACGNTSCPATLFGSASITATALPGYRFTGWSDCSAADDANVAAQPTLSYFIVFPEQRCKAHFEAIAPTTPTTPTTPATDRVRLTLNLPSNVHITDTNSDPTAVCNDAYCELAASASAGIFIETPWQGAGATPLILGSTCPDLHVSFLALVGNNVRYGLFTGPTSADRTCLLDLRPGGVFTASEPTDAHTTPTLSLDDTVHTYTDNTMPNSGGFIAVVPPNTSIGLWTTATHGRWSCSDGQNIPVTQYYWSAPIQAGQMASCTYLP